MMNAPQQIPSYLILLVFSSNVEALQQNFTKTWPLPENTNIIISQDLTAFDDRFIFTSCDWATGIQPLNCNYTVHTVPIGNRESHEATCTMKLISGLETYNYTLPSRTWSKDHFGTYKPFYVTVQPIRIFISNCTSDIFPMMQDIEISRDMYDNESFNEFLTGKKNCDGCNERRKESSDQENARTNELTGLQSDYLSHNTDVKKNGPSISGIWVIDHGNNFFYFKLDNKQDSKQRQLMRLEAWEWNSNMLQSSTANELDGICWPHSPKEMTFNCTQRDMNGNIKISRSLLHIPGDIMALHNLAEGGMLVVHGNQELPTRGIEVMKIKPNGSIDSTPLTLDFDWCFWRYIKIDVLETSDKFIFYLACKEMDESVQDVEMKLKFGIRRISKNI